MDSLRSALSAALTAPLRRTARRLRGRPARGVSFAGMTLGRDDVAEARRWLARPAETWSDPGPVRAFEAAFADLVGARAAFAFASARESLSAIIEAMGLAPGDEVVMPGYTCVVVPNAFAFAGVEVRYADIELDTFGLSAESLRQRVTPRTKAVVLHHLYGLVARDYRETVEVAREKGLWVIEDCAQATGARYDGQSVGRLGDAAIFSGEQTKGFTTIQGGLAVTTRADLADRLAEVYERTPEPDPEWTARVLQNLRLRYAVARRPYGSLASDWAQVRFSAYQLPPMSEREWEGLQPEDYGRRLPAPLAAIGLGQLAKLDRFNRKRRQAARHWNGWARKRGYAPPMVVEGSEPVYLRYPLLVEPGQKADPASLERDLGFRPGVWFATNLHPVTDRRPAEPVPRSDRAVAECINLPTLR